MEISVQDLKVRHFKKVNSSSVLKAYTAVQEDARTTITMSLAQTRFCKKHQYDPEDPLCAHVILTGKLVRVRIGRKPYNS
jgi:hypothetical protein